MKKLVELETSIQIFRLGDREKALQMAGSDEGRALMDAARATITALSEHMNTELETNRNEWLRGIELSRYSILAVGLLSFLLLITAFQLLSRDMQTKARIAGMVDSENARLGREVAERTHELNELTNYLQWTAEREKAAVARDLHDELGGILTSAKMDIDWLGKRIERSPETEKRLAQLNRLLDEAVSLKRRVIEDLRPSLLDNLGLAPALEWHVTEHCKSAGLICNLDIADLADVIDSDTAIAVYRIVQEALTNVIRHAKATRFELSLQSGEDGNGDARIDLRMRDNGVGLPASFNASKLSHGLSGMRQRARALGGDIAWESAPRQGTRIDVRIPIRQTPRAALDADAMPPIPGAALAAKALREPPPAAAQAAKAIRGAQPAQPTDPSPPRPST